MNPCFIVVIMIPEFWSINVIFPQVLRNVAPFHYLPHPPSGKWLPHWVASQIWFTLACCLRRLLEFIIRGMPIGMWSHWWMHPMWSHWLMHILIAILSSDFKRRNVFSIDNFSASDFISLFCFTFNFWFDFIFKYENSRNSRLLYLNGNNCSFLIQTWTFNFSCFWPALLGFKFSKLFLLWVWLSNFLSF